MPILDSTYHKPMGDLLTSALNRGVGYNTYKLIYELPYISVLYLYKNIELKRGWAYNTYYTVIVRFLAQSWYLHENSSTLYLQEQVLNVQQTRKTDRKNESLHLVKLWLVEPDRFWLLLHQLQNLLGRIKFL